MKMGLSDEAKRRAAESRRRYDAEHMRTLAAKLPTEEAEAFRAYAKRQGTTVSALLIAYIRGVLKESEVTNLNRGTNSTANDGKVTYTLRPSTVEGMERIAAESRVLVDHLVDAALAEFIAKWNSGR